MADGGRAAAAPRVLPSNLEAEGAVLSACLLDDSRAAIDAASALLRDGDWYADANRMVWSALCELDAAGQPVDVVLVAKRLRERGQLEQVGGMPYLAQLANATPAIAHVADHARIVADKARARRMIAQLQASALEGYAEKADVTAWAQDVARAVSEIAAHHPKDPPELMSELIPRVYEQACERARHGAIAAGIDTGWRDYTQALGGWTRGKMHVIGARPGMGKTSFVLGALLNVAEKGVGAAFASAEMSKEELAFRALALEANVDTRQLTTGRLSREEWSAVAAASERLRHYPLSIEFMPGATVTQIRSFLRSEQRRLQQRGFDLGIAAADYIQVLNGERKQGESRETEVASLSRGLTWIAGEFNIPLLAVSQLNRAVEARANKSKRPTMADLRESGAIEQDAFSVTLLYRDEYYNRNSDARGILEAIIAKNRGGATGTVLLHFTAESTRIANLSSQEDLDF